ncbi:MAG: hypothetical protein ACFFDT_10215 [Candidatus Hodarchaeota archaeon]
MAMLESIQQHPTIEERLIGEKIGRNGPESLKEGLERLCVPYVNIGTPGYPDSDVLYTEDLNNVEQVGWFLDMYGEKRIPGMRVTTYRGSSSVKTEAPASIRLRKFFGPGKPIIEVPFVSWNEEEDDWQWVAVETNGKNVAVHSWNTEELLENTRGYSKTPDSLYPHESTIVPGDLGSSEVRRAINWAVENARTLPICPESIMIISNENEEINRSRARVACNLWQISAQISNNIESPPPLLICNGLDKSVKEMREEAKRAGIPDGFIIDVVLPKSATTMDHGKEMLKQIEQVPRDIVVVTNSEHLMRTGIHLYEIPGLSEVKLHPFAVPSNIHPTHPRVGHEVKTLDRWQHDFIKKERIGEYNHYDYYSLPRAIHIWVRVSAGMAIG